MSRTGSDRINGLEPQGIPHLQIGYLTHSAVRTTLKKKSRLNGLTFSLLNIRHPKKFKPFSLLGQVSYIYIYNPWILTIDPNFLTHPSSTLQLQGPQQFFIEDLVQGAATRSAKRICILSNLPVRGMNWATKKPWNDIPWNPRCLRTGSL